MFKSPIIASSLLLMLTGCQTTHYNAATDQQETTNLVNGAIVGCTVAGTSTAVTGNGELGIQGCAAGPAVGGLIGSKMDQQEEDFRRELADTGVIIKRNDDHIKLILSGDILFPSGSAKVSQSIKSTLRSVVKVLKMHPHASLQVDGHTDNIGDHSLNHELSLARARSVATYFHASGLAYGRTNIDGFSDSVPLCSNESEHGRRCNRRVELTIFPN